MKLKIQDYSHVVVGFGDTPEAALDVAFGRLPFDPRSETGRQQYKRMHMGNPARVRGKECFKAEIGYDLAGDTPVQAVEAEKVKKRPGSFGPTIDYTGLNEML